MRDRHRDTHRDKTSGERRGGSTSDRGSSEVGHNAESRLQREVQGSQRVYSSSSSSPSPLPLSALFFFYKERW